MNHSRKPLTASSAQQQTGQHDVEVELQFAQALAAAAAIVNSSLDFELVLDRILDQVTRVVPGETYNIMLLEGGTGHIVRWRGYEDLNIPDHEIRGRATPVHAYATFRQMIKTGAPIVVNDTATSDQWTAPSDKSNHKSLPHPYDKSRVRHRHRAYLGAPIVIAGDVEGFINVNTSQPDTFTPQDARRLRAFADHAAIALQNARLFEETSRYMEILEQRVAQRTQELNTRAARLEAILKSTSDGIIVTDAAGDITQTNPVARTWLEHTLSHEDVAIFSAAVTSIAREADESSTRLVELSNLDLELKAAPITNPGTTAPATVIAIHDVSHLKALERMRSQFISDVSHELRTPIAAIQLYTALLRNNGQDEATKYLASLEKGVAQISHLVEAILQISRLEAGRIKIKPQPLDLNVIAIASVQSHAPEVETKGLHLSYAVPDTPIPILVDHHWFSEAIHHLLDNALKYTHAGTIQLTTSVACLQSKTWGQLSVEDTGIGIAPEEQARLFERFFRGDEARTAQIPGSGLGLSIVKGILDLHGGHVTVNSQKGKGSQFTLWVPLASSENCRIL